jgi:hypothetical protein
MCVEAGFIVLLRGEAEFITLLLQQNLLCFC